jgi:hypothetical protein
MGLPEHVVIDGNALVWQRVNLGNLGGESGVEQVAKGEALAFGDNADDF